MLARHFASEKSFGIDGLANQPKLFGRGKASLCDIRFVGHDERESGVVDDFFESNARMERNQLHRTVRCFEVIHRKIRDYPSETMATRGGRRELGGAVVSDTRDDVDRFDKNLLSLVGNPIYILL